MSTRCTINFAYGENIVATIYRHHDGYPDSDYGVLNSLKKFFTDVELQTHDTRFTDPSYLAAKFVVWQANEYSKSGKMLDFLSLGVCNKDPGDIDFRYVVNCEDLEENRPTITWERV